MRNKILAVTFLLCLSIIGCGNASQNTNNDMVSIDDYNKVVDERDYYKEQYEKIANQQSNNELPTNTTTDTETTTDTATENVSESSTNADINFNYYIDDLSSDAIVTECLAILDNIPTNGQTIDQYESSFKQLPLDSQIDEYFMFYYFTKEHDVRRNFPSKSAVSYVSGTNIGTQMDGTLALRSDQFHWMTIELCITDYETASAVYDGLYNALSPLYTDIDNRRDGTIWRASAMYKYTSNAAAGVEFMKLEKVENGYILQASKYYPV